MDNSINKQHKIIDEINSSISKLLEQTDKKKQKDVAGIRSDIDYLRTLLYSSKDGFDFNTIRIRFEEDYELKLPKYGVESFDRTLKGDMYFSVLGGNDVYMDIKTSSFPETFRIRLEYQTLREYENQYGVGYLIYSRGTQRLEGEDTKIYFKILKKS